MKVVFIGNCNTEAIAHASHAALSDDPDFSWKFYWRVDSVEPGNLAEIQKADRIVYQVMDFEAADAVKDFIDSAKDRVIRVPYLAGNFLWPFAAKAHPRNGEASTPYRLAGPYDAQLSDIQLIKLMQAHEGAPTHEIVDRYMELDFNAISPLDRYYEFNKHKYSRLGDSCGLDLWPTVEKYMIDHRPFWTSLHPSELILKPLARFALEQLGATPQGLARAMRTFGDPLGFVHMPVHPSVIRHFGIRSISEDETYRYFSEGRFTGRQYYQRFVDFEFDDELAVAIDDLHAHGQVEKAVHSLTNISRRTPGNPDAYYQAALGHERLGRLMDAAPLAIKALGIEPERPEFISLYRRVVRAEHFRAVASAVLKVGETNHFSDAASPSTAGLRSGWRAPESWGVWASRSESRLSYALDGLDSYGGRTAAVAVEVALRLSVGDATQGFGLEVTAEDKVVARWSFEADDYAKGEVVRTIERCPVSRLNGDDLISLKLQITGSRLLSSFDLGPSDSKFGLVTITVRRATTPAAGKWPSFRR